MKEPKIVSDFKKKTGFNAELGKFAGKDEYYVKEIKKDLGKTPFGKPIRHIKYTYPFKSTEEAEEYFLGKDPRKHRDYKFYGGK